MMSRIYNIMGIMKKSAVLFTIISIVCASCSQIGIVPDPKEVPMQLNIKVSDPCSDSGTKAAVKTSWNDNDLIQIWYDANTGDVPDLVIKYSGEGWVMDGTATISEYMPSASGYIKAVYSNNVAIAAKDAYTYQDGVLTVDLHTWTFLTEIQVVINDITEDAASCTLSCDRFSPYGGFTVEPDAITVKTGAKGSEATGIANADGIAFVFASSDLWDSETDYVFTLTAPSGVKTYTATATIIKPASNMKALKIVSEKFKAVPSLPEGALPGIFTIGLGKDNKLGTADDVKVRFSKGNLQATYHKSTSSYTFGFAANQYDYIGSAPGNTTINSQSDNAVVDLFGWPTEHNNYGILTSMASSDYAGDFHDWGHALAGSWRTPSIKEWQCLFSPTYDSGRGTGDKYFKCGVTVCGKTKCLVLAPDGNTTPIAASYDAEAWATAEAAGFVCLPAAGNRNGSAVSPATLGTAGYYSSFYNASNANPMQFNGIAVNMRDLLYIDMGLSVRLVMDVE